MHPHKWDTKKRERFAFTGAQKDEAHSGFDVGLPLFLFTTLIVALDFMHEEQSHAADAMPNIG
ncbi:MAG: hypothetical protein ACXVDN_01940 [Ktedonobacteraceae bacterium]